MMQHRNLLWFLLIVLVVIAIGLIMTLVAMTVSGRGSIGTLADDAVYIAVIGPMSGPDAAEGRENTVSRPPCPLITRSPGDWRAESTAQRAGFCALHPTVPSAYQ